MKYSDIKTFLQRCEEHPDHRTGMIGHADIQMRLHEEVEELRHFIEYYLIPKVNKVDFNKVRTIITDGRCIEWDNNEVNTAS